MLICTFFWGWYIYIKLALFLNPSNLNVNADGDPVSEDDDQYIDQNRNSYEIKRDIIRKNFKPKYFSFNVQFVGLMLTMTIRTGIYVGLRLVSFEKMFVWTYIKPCVFYLTYVTNTAVIVYIMYFIYNSAPLKEKYLGRGVAVDG